MLNKLDFEKDTPLFNLLLILGLTTLSYLNIFSNDFVMDDLEFILNWPLIQDGRNFFQFWGAGNQPPGQEGVYSPLKTCFHALSYFLFKEVPFGYHLLALGIHLATTALIYKIVSLLSASQKSLIQGRLPALVAALLFGVHPVHTEAITFMTASIDMIGVLFLFGGLLAYAQSEAASDRILWQKKYFTAILFSFLAIFTYELTIVLPLLFLLYAACFLRPSAAWLGLLKRLAPFFILAVGYAGLKFLVLGTLARGTYPYGSFYLTLLTSLKALWHYGVVLFWPVHLSTNHTLSPGIFSFAFDDFSKEAFLAQNFFDPQILAALLAGGLFLWISIYFWQQSRMAAFCLGWFLISLLPVSNIIPTGIFFGERYLYLASFAFCVGVVFFLARCPLPPRFSFWPREQWMVAVLIPVLVFYIGRTILRNNDWRDQLTFHSATAQECPGSALMQTNLGVVLTEYGLFHQAVGQFKKAIAINAELPQVYFAMADSYMMAGQIEKAQEALLKTIVLDPQFAEAYFNLAVTQKFLGREAAAQQSLTQATALYKNSDRFDEAEKAEQIFKEYFQSSEEPDG